MRILNKIQWLLLMILLFAGDLFAQDIKSKRDNENPDFNPSLPQGISQSYFNETDAIGAAWTTLAASPNALSRSCCVYAKPGGVQYIYQFGGGNTSAELRSIARYNIATNTWTVLGQTLNLDVSAGTAINNGDSVIYLFGGNSATSTLGSTQKFNIVTGITTTLASMPVAITDAAVVKYHDSLVYVIGGGTGLFGAGVVNNVQVYNIKRNTYAAATNYPIAAAMMGFGIDGNKIITAAGWIGPTGTPNAYKGVINPSNHLNIIWTALPNYPLGGVTRSASYLISKGTGRGIMFTGGAINGVTLTNKTYFFHTGTGCEAWDSTAPNSQARSNFKAAGRGDSVAWVVGGFTTVGVGTTERITFSSINCNQLANEISISDAEPLDSSSTDETYAPKAIVSNTGFNNQYNFSVTYQITGPTLSSAGLNYSSTKMIDTLLSGQSRTITFDSSFSPIDSGRYNANISSSVGFDNSMGFFSFTIFYKEWGIEFFDGCDYWWANSQSGIFNGPTFGWQNPPGAITLVNNSVAINPPTSGSLDDGYWGVVGALGNKFIKLCGVCYPNFYIGTNGIVGLGDAAPVNMNNFQVNIGGATPGPLPAILPLYMDLDFRPLSGAPENNLSYKITDEELIITWKNVRRWSGGVTDYVTFQACIQLVNFCLFGDSHVRFNYLVSGTGAGFKQLGPLGGIGQPPFSSWGFNNDVAANQLVGLRPASGLEDAIYYRKRNFLVNGFTRTGPLFGGTNDRTTNLALEFASYPEPLNLCGNGLPCIDFNDRDLSNWTSSGCDTSTDTPGPSGHPTDFYFRIVDHMGPAANYNNVFSSGDWNPLYNGMCLCFDFRLFDGGGYNPPPTTTTISLLFGPYSVFSPRANFVINQQISQTNGWYHFCAPLSQCMGILPSNNSGHWEMSGFNPANDCVDWNTTLNNVSGIFINGDVTESSSEIAGYDNICIKPCNPQTLCVKLCLQGCEENSAGQEVQISIRSTIPIYPIIETLTGFLDFDGNVCLNFNQFHPGENFYLYVKHKNSIPTWSQIVTAPSQGTTFNYNFTDASSKALGNNMILVGSKWCIYTGDVNQDGIVDATDCAAIDNDAFNFVTGNVATDLNCDGIVDAADAALCDNNLFNFVMEIPPPGLVATEPIKVSPDLPNNNLNDMNSVEPKSTKQKVK